MPVDLEKIVDPRVEIAAIAAIPPGVLHKSLRSPRSVESFRDNSRLKSLAVTSSPGTPLESSYRHTVVFVTPRIIARSSCVSRRVPLIFLILSGVMNLSFAIDLGMRYGLSPHISIFFRKKPRKKKPMNRHCDKSKIFS